MSNSITPDHVYELTTVAEPALSPDGARLAFVKSNIDKEQMATRSHIMMMEMPDGKPHPFTQGKSDASPKFSANGESIAFTRRDDKGRMQVWVMPAFGGEARQLTHETGGAFDHAWSPDSRHLAFVSWVDPDRLAEDHDHQRDPRVRVVRRVRYRHDHHGWLGDAFRHLFVVDAQTGETRQLTDGEGDNIGPVWSPDGERVACVSDQIEERDFTNHSEAHVIDVNSGVTRSWSESLVNVWSLAWSPDGQALAAIGNHDAAIWDSRQAWLYVLEPGVAPKQMTDGSFTPVPDAPELRWTDNGRIMFIGVKRGESYLCQVPAEGGALSTVAGGGAQYLGLALDSTAENAVVVITSPCSTEELAHVNISAGTQTQLTHYNREYFTNHPPAKMEKFCTTRGGVEIESRVFFPPDFDATGQYPMVLDIHGGPNGRFSDSFDPVHHVLATAGYVVLAVNPRGSSSYSPEFAKAVLGDWGGEDYLDIMAAVDELCSRSYVDNMRLGVHGYSYGGFMSSWIVGHDNHFKAAVVGAPCTNLYSMHGTSDIGVSFGELNWGGAFQDARDAFLEHSPLTYAANVNTPVLLLHGENDLRCPIAQSEEYYVALKRMGKEVEFVRFPGSAHSFRRSGHPKLRVEALKRMLDWMNKYV